MRLTELISEFEDHLDAETTTSFWGAQRITRYLDQATRALIRLTHQLDETHLLLTTTITTVSGTPLYDFPRNGRRGAHILFVADNVSKNEYSRLNRYKDYLSYEGTGIHATNPGVTFTMEGDQLRITPTPSGVDTLLVGYTGVFGNLLEGACISGSTTTFKLWTGAPNWTANYGVPSLVDDQYIGMQALVYEGTNVGEIRTVSDYTASTREFTVSEAFSSAMDSTSKVAILPPIDEDWHSLIALRAAWRGTARNRNRERELAGMYQYEESEYKSWMEERIRTAATVTEPVNYGDY